MTDRPSDATKSVMNSGTKRHASLNNRNMASGEKDLGVLDLNFEPLAGYLLVVQLLRDPLEFFDETLRYGRCVLLQVREESLQLLVCSAGLRIDERMGWNGELAQSAEASH